MSTSDETIKALREALKHSPNNLPLRQHLANTLLGYGRLAEAEEEYRQCLKMDAKNQAAQIGLAKALYQQDNLNPAINIIKDLMQHSTEIIPAEVYLLYARLLLALNNKEQAIRQYALALDVDPLVTDPSLAEQLGIPPDSTFQSLQSYFESAPQAAPVSNFNAPLNQQAVPVTTEDLPLDDDIVDLEQPDVSFDDVGGMDKVKEEIEMKIIHPLSHPEIYAAYGKKIGGGILMYGPPGCGKTHLARATAGQVKAKFLAVGISDVLDMWLGNSEKNLHNIFEQARNNRPCVLFFDEVDALGASRTDMRQSGGRHIINQFLSELDGINATANEGVLILAATNAPWHLDSAFRRPGRFDRIIFVPPPDLKARAAILRILLKDKPLKDVDYTYLAKKTKDFSGADLQAVVDVTVEAKLRDAMKRGVPTPITTKDLHNTLRKIKPSTKEWFSTARNYVLYANQGGIYDDIMEYLKL